MAVTFDVVSSRLSHQQTCECASGGSSDINGNCYPNVVKCNVCALISNILDLS